MFNYRPGVEGPVFSLCTRNICTGAVEVILGRAFALFPGILTLTVAMLLVSCGGEPQGESSSSDIAGSSTTPREATVPSGTPASEGPLEGYALVDALRGGGYVVYFRHAKTDESVEDQRDAPDFLGDCSLQRDLNEEGEMQAQAIGQAFRDLGIPVGEVLSSEYCRTRKTAEIAFGEADSIMELTSPFFDERYGGSSLDQKNVALREYLGATPPSGSNTVMVAHEQNLTEALDVNLGIEGEAAVFRPGGDGRFEFVAQVLPEEWAELVQ